MAISRISKVIQHLRKEPLTRDGAECTDGQLLERFVKRRDEAAIAALVRRHGPMIWAVCRRILGHHDAEDAFQATYLVLIRKASSIVPREMVANWLYGVAYQTSLKARQLAGRRRAREKQVSEMPQPAARPQEVWHDLQALLDEELSRLPDRYRITIVLCDLAGKTRKQAARQLGVPEGTVAGRLARARKMLAKRLTKRGVVLSAGALATVLAQNAASAALPSAVASATIKAASFAATGQALGAITAKVAILVKGVMTMMLLQKLKLPALGLVLVASVFCIGGWHQGTAGARQASNKDGSPAALTPLRNTGDTQQAPNKEDSPAALIPPRDKDDAARFVTANFVVLAPTEEMARSVGRRAEAERERLAALWFGQETPNWRERCLIRVKAAKKAAGATLFQYDEKRLHKPKQEIRVEGPMDDILKDVLPQQITHTLLAHDLGVAYARWAETGAGILSQSERARRSHLEPVRNARARGKLLRIERLFELKDYPREADVMIAQSASVTQFLVERKGRANFLAFVERGMQRGWDQALQRYYGLDNVAALEVAWLKSLDIDQEPDALPQNRRLKGPVAWANKLFDADHHDFGSVPRNSQKMYRFRLQNIYKVPLEITGIRVPSSAVKATASVRQIQPGEVAFIEVLLDARRFSGNRSMSIYVDFGSDYVSTATLSVSANFCEDDR